MSLITLFNRIKPSRSVLTKLLSTSTKQDPSTEGEKPKKPKTVPIPRITLLTSSTTGDHVSVSTLQEAQKLAKRRDLKLVKIVDLDTKTQRPIYKLMTGAEYHAEDLKQRDERKKERLNSNTLKGEKVLIINCKISEHDLKTHCNKMLKWIAKRYEIRVVINADANSMDKAESIYGVIENNLKEAGGARILQKRLKGHELKFQIVPLKIENAELKEPKIS